jgi:hypothetical protein
MPRTSDGIRSTQTNDGRIILDVHRGQMLSVNVVGSRILELLEMGWEETSIVDEISRAYEAPIEVVRPDVRDFFEALRKHHVVQAAVPVNSN